MRWPKHFDWRLEDLSRTDLQVVLDGLTQTVKLLAMQSAAMKNAVLDERSRGHKNAFLNGCRWARLDVYQHINAQRRQVRDVIRKQDARAHARGLIQSELARQEQEGQLSIAEQADYDLLFGVEIDNLT
jgi:hypothetical protein